MKILRRKKQKANGQIKKHLRDWLVNLIEPETAGKVKTDTVLKVKPHVHGLTGETTVAKGHAEKIALFTGKPIITKEGHIHKFGGTIVAEGMETHCVEGMTGPVLTKGKDHYHRAIGRTVNDKKHGHRFDLPSSGALRKTKSFKESLKKEGGIVVSPAALATREMRLDMLPVED